MEYEIAVNNTAVYADGGTIQDNFNAEKVVTFLKRNNLWASCVGLWMPQSGLKKDGNQLVSKMYDVKGNNHAWQTTGSYQPSYSDGSLLFDGLDDALSLTSPLSGNTDLHISMWVRPLVLAERDIFFSSFGLETNTIGIEKTITGTIRLYWNINGVVTDLFSLASIEANQWSFITIVRDKIGGRIKFYVNGILSISHIASPGDLNMTVPPLIGRDSRIGSGLPTNGSIGLIYLSYTTHTDAQVLAFYNNTKGIYGL
jgi:hypothetical protein